MITTDSGIPDDIILHILNFTLTFEYRDTLRCRAINKRFLKIVDDNSQLFWYRRPKIDLFHPKGFVMSFRNSSEWLEVVKCFSMCAIHPFTQKSLGRSYSNRFDRMLAAERGEIEEKVFLFQDDPFLNIEINLYSGNTLTSCYT